MCMSHEPTSYKSRLFRLTQVYFVVVNNVEEINNEITENTKMRK